MLYQRRMRLPHVEDPTLNGVPLERMMLSYPPTASPSTTPNPR